METKDIKVATVVVTYNRLELLKECVEALRAQTYKNVEFIIVNNGSTDGTREWLASQKDLIVINQENVGGAGGFYAGMKYMFEHDYDALWMMDDDGLPDSHQLEYLITYSQKYTLDMANALVIKKNDRTRLCMGNLVFDADKYDAMEIWYEDINPFNGTFVYRHVIEKVGFIKKEMFIWGDEVEYYHRVKKNGFKVATITKARHYHPAFKGTQKRIIPFIPVGTVVYKPAPINRVYYRNLGYLDANYFRYKNLIKSFVYYVLRLRFKDLAYFLKYYKMGVKNDYSVDVLMKNEEST